MKRNVALTTCCIATLALLMLNCGKNDKKGKTPSNPAPEEADNETGQGSEDETGAEFYRLQANNIETCDIADDGEIKVEVRLAKVLISPTHCHLAILDYNNRLTFWDMEKHEEIASVEQPPSEIKFSRDGQYLMSNSTVYEVATGDAIIKANRSERMVSFGSGDSAIAVANEEEDHFNVRRYDLKNGALTAKSIKSPLETNKEGKPRLTAAPLPNGEILLAFQRESEQTNVPDILFQRLDLSADKAHTDSTHWNAFLSTRLDTFATQEGIVLKSGSEYFLVKHDSYEKLEKGPREINFTAEGKFVSFNNVHVVSSNTPAGQATPINHSWKYYNPLEGEKSDFVEFADQGVLVIAWQIHQNGEKALTLISTRDGNQEYLVTRTAELK